MIERILDLENMLNKKSIFIFGPRQTGKTTFLKHNSSFEFDIPFATPSFMGITNDY